MQFNLNLKETALEQTPEKERERENERLSTIKPDLFRVEKVLITAKNSYKKSGIFWMKGFG